MTFEGFAGPKPPRDWLFAWHIYHEKRSTWRRAQEAMRERAKTAALDASTWRRAHLAVQGHREVISAVELIAAAIGNLPVE